MLVKKVNFVNHKNMNILKYECKKKLSFNHNYSMCEKQIYVIACYLEMLNFKKQSNFQISSINYRVI